MMDQVVIAKTKRPKKQCQPADRDRFKTEVHEYFKARTAKLNIVKTTITKHGQTIDWIPIESQGPIAKPPPLPEGISQHMLPCTMELEHEGAERGPEGTVPILRKTLETVAVNKPLRKYLARFRGRQPSILFSGTTEKTIADPEEDGTHRYGFSRQSVLNWGGEGNIQVWDPWVEVEDDFSLLQIGVLNLNDNPGVRQSVEAGWQVYQDLYGDWSPHLFVYYTTNDYHDGDNKGGYNTDVDGWMQYDSTIFPGTRFAPTSTVNGQHYQIFIKYQLFEGNWWFNCLGRWIGYYPARLWQGNQGTFEGLGDHADHIGFWGEVFDSDDGAGRTKTDMGSGIFPDGGGQSAFMTNLKFQSTRADGGNMENYDGGRTIVQEDPDMYRIDPHFHEEPTQWESWQNVGGPGAG
jgi:hypothetical protein